MRSDPISNPSFSLGEPTKDLLKPQHSSLSLPLVLLLLLVDLFGGQALVVEGHTGDHVACV